MRVFIILFVPSFFSYSYPNDLIPIGPDSVTVNGVFTSFSYDLLLVSDGTRHHHIKWNAENFASGVYFFKMKSDFGTKTGKCILIK